MKTQSLTPDRITLLPFPKWIGAPDRNARIHLLLGGVRGHALCVSWPEALRDGWITELPSGPVRQARSSAEGYALVLQCGTRPARLVVIGDTARAIQYAKVSADQLLRLNPPDRLPEVLVLVDWPDLPIRAVNRTLICSRPDAPEYYFEEGTRNWEDIFRRMVDLKLNTFFIHSGWGEGIRALIDARGRRQPFVDQMVRKATAMNLDVGGLLVHSLETGGRMESYGQTYPDLTDPKNRRRVLATFRQLIRAYPEMRYWVVHNEEHRRGKDLKQPRVSFEQEFFSYVKEYRRILKQENPRAILVVCPYYQLGFPYVHLRYLEGGYRQLGNDVRTFWWTDNYPQQYLPQFLSEFRECMEAYVFDRLPRVWHWFYMNGWTDFTFPCPTHFRTWIQAGLRSGHIEACSGENAFYRGNEWNNRALAQFAWNSRLTDREFDTQILRSWAPAQPTEPLRRCVETYRQLLTDYLRAIFQQGHHWRDPGTPDVIRAFRRVGAGVDRLERRFRGTIGRSPLRPRSFSADFLQDLEILRREVELRQMVRDAYRAWADAEQSYCANRKAEGAARLRQSLARLRSARTSWRRLRKVRVARGVWHDTFNSAPVTRMERVWDDMIKNTRMVLKLRNRGYGSWHPRWNEWTEFNWIFASYATFR